MKTADFLFELGCEELPAGALSPMAEHLHTHVEKALAAAKFQFAEVFTYYTPRRLALLIKDLQTEKPTEVVERRGPAKVAGFDANGNPTKALEGFLKSCNAEVTDIIEVETDKGVWLAVKIEKPAEQVKSALPEILTQAIKTLPMKKAMRWGDHEFAFLRPVHWVVALLGEEVVPMRLFDIEAGADSFGHRFHHPGKVNITQPDTYVETLRKAKVMVDAEERREVIVTETNALLAKDTSAHFGKLAEVVNLVEWPVALRCQFEEGFLSLPKEVLIATMEANQRVFPVHDNKQSLRNIFITIANIVSTNPAAVVHGNEKVVRARLADAKFFFDEDLKVPLKNHLAGLKKITFQHGLGSLYNRVERLETLVESGSAKQAAHLCKADLCTHMVQEFPELQGYMGHQYAIAQGCDLEVAEAIEDHYKPKGRGGELPRNESGVMLALADKIDTLVGMFAIGKEPTSSGDPFALRRQALGVIAILVEKKIHFDLQAFLKKAYAAYQVQNHTLAEEAVVLQKLEQFFKERLEVWCREEKNLPAGVVRAILGRRSAHNTFDVFDIYERSVVLNTLLQTEAGDALKELAKRIHNILADVKVEGQLDSQLLVPAEKMLAAILTEVPEWTELSLEPQYRAYLQLSDPIAGFFEAVLVNDENLALRKNRQLLLQQARDALSQLADFTKL